MTRYLLLILGLLTVALSSGQQLPIDFQTSINNFTGFNGASFSIVGDPADAANPTGQINNAGNTWEGLFIDLNTQIDLSTNKIITLKFYSYDSNSHSVLLKLELGNDSDVEVSQTASSMGWNTLSFDFSAATLSPPNSGTINASGSYGRLVVFIDGALTSSGTFLLDDIDGADPGVSTLELDVIYDELVWSEEFNSNGAVSASNWFAETVPPNNGSWWNEEVQHYTDRFDNAYVSDGTLKIVAKKETYTAYGSTKDYTSARLNSLFSFTFGRVDVRAKMPVGDGTWPAIWMLGTSIGNSYTPPSIPWPLCGEIDIMEHWGNNPNVIHGSIHNGASSGATVNTNTIWAYDVSNTFHIYSMNWSPDKITFLVDNNIYYIYNPSVQDSNTWPFDDPQFILLNIAMGGVGGAIDPFFTESTMEVDYVRVYQESALNLSNEELQDVKIYPNPVTDELQITIPDRWNNSTIQILSLHGKPMLNRTIIEKRSKLNLTKIPAGMYFVRLSKDGQFSTFKLIKK